MTARLGLILLLALISVSTTSLVIRYVATVPVLVLAFWRMFTASGMLWGFSVAKPQGSLSLLNKKRTIFAGIFLGFHFACFFVGVRHTSIANATLLANMGPIFTLLIALAQGRKSNTMTYLGLGMAVVGAIIIQANDFSILGGENFFGNSLALLSALFFALTYVVAEAIRVETGNIVYGRALFLVAAITLLVIAVLSGNSIFDFQPQHIVWLLFLGLVPSILGHNMLNYAVKYVTPTAVSSVSLGEPIIASLFGLFLFGEAIPVSAILGGPIILIGVYIIINNQVSGANN